jgi:hypothetical protein
MILLAPLALLWLGSLGALLWLWRLSSSRRQVRVPSLIPFERLLRRSPRSRTRVVVNVLFWLQCAALIGLCLALARPILFQPRAKTILAILDTSASLGASTRFSQAKRALLARITRKAPTEQLFIVTTAPAAPLTPQPTGDPVTLNRLIESVRVSHLGGNLSSAARLGRSLLGDDPEELLVVTDEPPPEDLDRRAVQWVTVGQPAPNAAIVGLDAQGPLCAPETSRAIVTLQNFSDEPAQVVLAVRQGRRELSELRYTLSPNERPSVSLELPDDTEGWVECSLSVPRDGLEVDNHAWVRLRRSATLPIVIRSSTPAFVQTVSSWLSACPSLRWDTKPIEGDGPFLVITDQEATVEASATSAMVFLPPASPKPMLTHWVMSARHPIGSYLAPVEVVPAALNLSAGPSLPGLPVIFGLSGGRKIPVVVADEREGRRLVFLLFDPSGRSDSTPILLAFFNSLRWLMGDLDRWVTGDPLTLGPVAPGPLTVHRPDGSTDTLTASGRSVHYEASTLAGLYRVVQGSTELQVAANFLDPMESNLRDRISTWRAEPVSGGSSASSRRSPLALSNWLLIVVVILLVIEWYLYTAKRP